MLPAVALRDRLAEDIDELVGVDAVVVGHRAGGVLSEEPGPLLGSAPLFEDAAVAVVATWAMSLAPLAQLQPFPSELVRPREERNGTDFGKRRLGLAGIGENGGGRGEGICLCGEPDDAANGIDQGPRPMRLRLGALEISAGLPREVVQRIFQTNAARFRLCYEGGLQRKAELEGRVAVGFEIDATGQVVGAGDAGSDLPDDGAVACAIRAVEGLSFPAPEESPVRVVAPILFLLPR
jgi:hypothetical protein